MSIPDTCPFDQTVKPADQDPYFDLVEFMPFLLKNALPLSKEGLKGAIEILTQFEKDSRWFTRPDLSLEGPCLCCSAHIEYKVCSTHLRYGQFWFEKFSNRTFRVDISVRGYYRSDIEHCVRINGGAYSSAEGYLCEECLRKIDDLFYAEIAKEKRQAKIRTQESNKRSEDTAAFLISPGATLSADERNRPNLLIYIEPQHSAALKSLQYKKQFLSTPYWVLVRLKKLRQAGYRCELCSAKDQLHVHHKTYEHHGEEHRHLEDLIVLCWKCHGTFHGKLPAEDSLG